VRIVLGEDSVLLREGLVRLLAEAGHDVVGTAGDAPTLLAEIDRHRPDLAVVDVRMPPTFSDDGLRAAVTARAAHPDLTVLVLSQYVELTYARELLADGRGGAGYLLKDRVQDLDALIHALDTVASGGTVLDPELVSQLLARRRPGPLDALTPRERDVLALIAQGRSNHAIGAQLFIGDGAVEKHISNIFSKLGLMPSDEDHRRVLAALAFVAG
jgi:DNA-binding NarL/FixJ family response regulator